ncbi:MAG: glutaminase A [Scytonema sp. PMC 1069.18]|nr:glutaminase A [Scytonema sp. PMC 1069.18]MEC4884163.1 glutaminase A [Scytonema sp. PMC 1070.18]
MGGLTKLTTTKLSAWVQQARALSSKGRVVDRIPQLALANPDWFAVYICCQEGQSFTQGDTACVFPLMSVIKPFSLLYLLEHMGAETVFEWVGIEPSDAAFNSIKQLVADSGRPRNPMINSGAITLADKLPGKNTSDRSEQLCQWLNQMAGCNLELNEEMLVSVRLGQSINRVLAHCLTETGYLENREQALDTYQKICCLSGTVEDLARLGMLLACESGLVQLQHRRSVNALLLSCGLYESSPKYAVRIGLPMKSGISGALLAIVPGQGAIACYSPPLDSAGNSVAAIAFVEALSQELQLSIFGS